MKIGTSLLIIGVIFVVAWVSIPVFNRDMKAREARIQAQRVSQFKPEDKPVFRFVGRMNMMSTRSENSIGYVFERGGLYEYVQASNVQVLTETADTNLPSFYLKIGDMYWGLHKY